MKKIYLIFITFILFTQSAFAKEMAIVSNLQWFHVDDNLRIIMEVKYSAKTLPNKIFLLTKPDRLVIDIENAKWNLKNLNSSEMFQTIRYGQQNSVLRIVFDLKEEMEIKKKIYSAPTGRGKIHKLTIDIGKKRAKNNLMKKYNIIIDAGHGGNDPGSMNKILNLREKDIALIYALELKHELEMNKNYRVALTRFDDSYLSLDQRRLISEKQKADLFISLHVDSNEDENINGASIYTLSDNSFEEQASLLTQDKKALSKLDIEEEKNNVANLIVDMVMNSTKNSCSDLAKDITVELSKTIKMISKPHRFGEFKVIKDIKTPAILIELGHISNEEEAKKLLLGEYRNNIVSALTKSIDRHFDL